MAGSEAASSIGGGARRQSPSWHEIPAARRPEREMFVGLRGWEGLSFSSAFRKFGIRGQLRFWSCRGAGLHHRNRRRAATFERDIAVHLVDPSRAKHRLFGRFHLIDASPINSETIAEELFPISPRIQVLPVRVCADGKIKFSRPCEQDAEVRCQHSIAEAFQRVVCLQRSVLIPSIKSFLFFEGVTETVVRGQRRISPPRDSFRTAVSGPVVRDDPAAIRLPASVYLAASGDRDYSAATGLSDNSLGDWSGDFLVPGIPVFGSL